VLTATSALGLSGISLEKDLSATVTTLSGTLALPVTLLPSSNSLDHSRTLRALFPRQRREREPQDPQEKCLGRSNVFRQVLPLRNVGQIQIYLPRNPYVVYVR
jgi:hypothetical protein